jgi:hypothetical protein
VETTTRHNLRTRLLASTVAGKNKTHRYVDMKKAATLKLKLERCVVTSRLVKRTGYDPLFMHVAFCYPI